MRSNVNRILAGEPVARPGAIGARIGVTGNFARNLCHEMRIIRAKNRLPASGDLRLGGRIELKGAESFADPMPIDLRDRRNIRIATVTHEQRKLRSDRPEFFALHSPILMRSDSDVEPGARSSRWIFGRCLR